MLNPVQQGVTDAILKVPSLRALSCNNVNLLQHVTLASIPPQWTHLLSLEGVTLKSNADVECLAALTGN